MADKYVLDTHALLWFLANDPRLGAKAKAAFMETNARWVVSTIVLAEACWVIALGRTNIPSPQAFLDAIEADPRVIHAYLTPDIVRQAVQLQDIPEMHDRLIAATAISLANEGHTVALVTKDARISQSRLLGAVQVVW